jgi:hypothetical protein
MGERELVQSEEVGGFEKLTLSEYKQGLTLVRFSAHLERFL